MALKNRHLKLRNLYILPLVGLVLTAFMAMVSPRAAQAVEITVYKSAQCGCCGNWVKYMRARGYKLAVRNMDNLDAVKKMAGVPDRFQSCHTALVDGYVVEGHVPAADVARLLAERPKARGIAVPGMPMGSPGMEGRMSERYHVVLFGGPGGAKIFASH
jgi:hypothetical protein